MRRIRDESKPEPRMNAWEQESKWMREDQKEKGKTRPWCGMHGDCIYIFCCILMLLGWALMLSCDLGCCICVCLCDECVGT